jgi:hypothetical protein
MTLAHSGQDVDAFDLRSSLETHGFAPQRISSEETDVLLDATVVEVLSLMRERGYIDERSVFVSKGNGVIGIRDTSLADRLDDSDR